MQLIVNPEKKFWAEYLRRPSIDNTSLESSVRKILNEVKQNGDTAVKKFTLEFDGVLPDTLEAADEEIKNAVNGIPKELREAISLAADNIRKFHTAQREEKKVIETSPGVQCWRKNTAIEKVGLYIPGGSAPLFSTVLMLAIPAVIAGCKEIIICSPPGKNGKIDPSILYAAHVCGAVKIFKIGGVQAIGAMAYGTQSVPRVYKIFGPGNQYVTCAKQIAAGSGIAIDMPAGPSELAVFADETCIPEFVAADLLSQAEHGADSQVILVTTKNEIAAAVQKEVNEQLEMLPRKAAAAQALANSKIFIVENENTAIDLLNEYAAEHLILACKNADDLAERVINAGSVFIGNYSCESAGDYASGTNHTLPTNGFAKSFSGVSLDSFVKKITFQKVSEQGLKNIGPAIEIMAEAEKLRAHKNAVSIRLNKLSEHK